MATAMRQVNSASVETQAKEVKALGNKIVTSAKNMDYMLQISALENNADYLLELSKIHKKNLGNVENVNEAIKKLMNKVEEITENTKRNAKSLSTRRI